MAHYLSSTTSTPRAASDLETMVLRFYKEDIQKFVNKPELEIGCMGGTHKNPDIQWDSVIDSLLWKTRLVVAHLLQKCNNPEVIKDEITIQKSVDDYNANRIEVEIIKDGSQPIVTYEVAPHFFSRRQALVLLAAANALDNKV